MRFAQSRRQWVTKSSTGCLCLAVGLMAALTRQVAALPEEELLTSVEWRKASDGGGPFTTGDPSHANAADLYYNGIPSKLTRRADSSDGEELTSVELRHKDPGGGPSFGGSAVNANRADKYFAAMSMRPSSRRRDLEKRASGASVVNIDSPASVQSLHSQATVRLQDYYQNNSATYEWVPWWQQAVVALAFVDYDIVVPGNTYRDLATAILDTNTFGVNYLVDNYVDDSGWWGLLTAKAYQIYGNQQYLNSAKAIQYNMSTYWTDACGGGVSWQTINPNYKNTVTNTLFMAVSARLFLATKQQNYYNDAINTLNWWVQWAYDPSSGAIYDSLTQAPDCKPYGLNAWTYNAGVILSALSDLYNATANSTYLALGESIAHNAMVAFSDSNGVLHESCENTGDYGCQQDEQSFKGVLAMGLGYLYSATRDSNLRNFINTNLLANVQNNMDYSYLFSESWDGPFNATLAGPKTQIGVMPLLTAAVTANRLMASTTNSGYRSDNSASVSIPLSSSAALAASSADRTALTTQGWTVVAIASAIVVVAMSSVLS